MALTLDRLGTPIGEALLVSDADGSLRAFEWADCEARLKRLLRHPLEVGRAPAALRDAFDAYFSGEFAALAAVPWRADGTAFQQAVWRALTQIPPGRTLSYTAMAETVGRPTAVRAVGRANSSNVLGVAVPCHRLVGSGGALTGYGSGLHRKAWLLRHEGWLTSAEAA